MSSDGPVDELAATASSGDGDGEGAPVTGPTAGLAGDDGSFLRQVAGMTPAVSPPPIGPGVVVDGTYRIERRLGAGGMGVVYLARDLKLARDVALKVHSQRAAERLAREAKAIAQLVHPNVVTVHEIGTYEGHPFVAMEYLDGGTARTWLAEKPRPWRDVLALYLAAARGLAAAHRAGLVHRDFKPDNVLVGLDGRVRVADFGLARDLASIEEVPAEAGATARDNALQPITATGTVMGTPAYMAPEQHAGEPAGPEADQFAFCVSLWEAWFTQRPFAGHTRATIAEAVAAGAIRAPGGDRKVPRRLRRALERGLAADPAARHPSMQALITALGRDRRRLVALVGGAAALGVAGLAAGLVLAGGGDDRTSCARLADSNPVWTPARKAALEAGFTATGREFAGESFSRLAARLDRYTADLRAQRIEVCQAHRAGKQSPQLHDLRNLCLDGRKAELATLIDTFAAVDRELIDRAVTASRSLGALETCGDVAALSGITPLPEDPATRDAIARLEIERGALRAMQIAGRWKDGLSRIRAATAEAATLGYAPLTARLTHTQAFYEKDAGEHAAARTSQQEALRLAALAHDTALEVEGWIFLVNLVSDSLGRNDEAASLLPAAEAAVARAGNPPLLRARLTSTTGALRHNQGQLDQALALLEDALRQTEAATEKDSPDVALVLNRLAMIEAELGRPADAERRLRRGIAILEQAYGEHHPNVASNYNNLGSVLRNASHYEEAQVALERALAIKESVRGPDHPELVTTLSSLGFVKRALDRTEDGRRDFERALGIARAKLGPDHVRTAQLEFGLASILVTLSDHAAAKALFEHAIAVEEKRLGADHPDLIITRVEYSAVLRLMGQHRAARAQLERAMATAQAKYGPDHHKVASVLSELGELREAEGDLQGAVTSHREAVAIYTGSMGPSHPQTIRERQALANALIGVGDLAAAERELTLTHAALIERFGPDHAEVGMGAFGLGRVAALRDDVDGAMRRFTEARAILERSFGPDSPGVAVVLTGESDALLGMKRVKEAEVAARRLLVILDDPRAAIPALRAAESRFVAGKVLHAAGDRALGHALVTAARAVFAADTHPNAAGVLANIDAWLGAHPQ